ncbi:MAG: hypothetical protein HRU20_17625 [Pseudomonadales bacterium]|nr:hypothetical protein [Pseudomonadales bacterium]
MYSPGFDAAHEYSACQSPSASIPKNTIIKTKSSNATGYFSINNRNYIWGTGGGSFVLSGTRLNKYCFHPDETYTLHSKADSTSSKYKMENVSGNFLNWYFSASVAKFHDPLITSDDPSINMNTPDFNWGRNGLKRKVKLYKRTTVAKDVAKHMIADLEDVNVGLASYKDSTSSDGGDIDYAISDVEQHRANLIKKIDQYGTPNWTPLAETFEAIGNYFSLGGNKKLILHPGTTNQQKVSRTSVFKQTPDYRRGSKDKVAPMSQALWCQKNYLVALTDGEPTQDRNVSSYLRDYDGDCKDGSCSSYDMKNDSDYSYASSSNDPSDYMDDVTAALFDMDLRPDINDFSGNPVKNNIITYLIGFGDKNILDNQLFYDTAKNGGGEYYKASDGQALVQALKEINQAVKAKSSSVTSVAVSFTNTLVDSNLAFQSTFNTQNWSGAIKAYEVNDKGLFVDALDASNTSKTTANITPHWNAADKLNQQDPASRRIITWGKNGPVDFSWANAGQLTARMFDDLMMVVSNVSEQEAIFSYFRGVTDYDGVQWRKRVSVDANGKISGGSLLGDIVHSSPVYVSSPARPWPATFGQAGKRYSDFKKSQASRPPMLYVGANDGMLHAFNASKSGSDAGQEKLAYIPEFLSSTQDKKGLHYLAEKDYGHAYYVDMTPTLSDVYMKLGGANKDWHTILLGSARSGGKGFFALNVTEPAKFSTAAASQLALWEFSETDDADIGYNFGNPLIAKVKFDSNSLNGNGNGRWAVITGNGYNSSGGDAVLFIIFLDGGLDGTWTEGKDYIKLTTRSGNASSPNGLSAPQAVDLDGDMIMDRVYAGDLLGNMWVFDINSSANSSNVQSNWKTTRLFTAGKNSSDVQPITSAPMLARNPDIKAAAPNLMVMFGTGQYIENDDIKDLSVQSIYAVHDRGDTSLRRYKSSAGVQQLQKRTFTETLSTSGLQVREGESNAPDIDWDKQWGWYADLYSDKNGNKNIDSAEIKGERLVFNPIVVNQYFVFNSLIPTTALCSGGTEGWTMLIDWTSGLAPDDASFDANQDGKIDALDIGYLGLKTNQGQGQIAKMGDNIIASEGDDAKMLKINWGAGSGGARLNWEEHFPD